MSKLRFFISVVLVIVLLFDASSGQAATACINNEVTSKVKVRIQKHSRRVLTDVLDYDYGGPNSKHEPRKKPGNGHAR
ncbi:uncharacterized protein LOC107304243 [Oryza brachyantha]|uniref:Neprosin activation peptide domain-containing protein n=1 Tax=Oryza brachyantha TaxID=4533 RepID=J3M9B9_ORYBR|nr:uncharacterized protein LOC107304243 [Oryza brachyantha]